MTVRGFMAGLSTGLLLFCPLADTPLPKPPPAPPPGAGVRVVQVVILPAGAAARCAS